MRISDLITPRELAHGWARCRKPEWVPCAPPRRKQDSWGDALEAVMVEVVERGLPAARKRFPDGRFGRETPMQLAQRVTRIARRDGLPLRGQRRGEWVYIVNDDPGLEADGGTDLEAGLR
jgi:hypothetical protein